MPQDSLAELTARLRNFAVRRDWEPFHSPKNLAMAVAAEAGELAAEFLWIEGPESRAPDPERLARIRFEAADVLNYLVRLADTLQFDLVAAANAKIDQNEQRYPAAKVRGLAKKYDEY